MRLLNRPLALVLALALAAAGVIVVIEVIAVAVHAAPVVVPWNTWLHWARRTHWNREVVKVWAIILMVAGLLLLVIELKPRRVTRVAMSSDNEHTDAGMTRKGLAGSVRQAVLDVDGVAKADVRVNRRTVKIGATASARDPEGAAEMSDPVADAARQQLESLRLARTPRIRSTVKAGGS